MVVARQGVRGAIEAGALLVGAAGVVGEKQAVVAGGTDFSGVGGAVSAGGDGSVSAGADVGDAFGE